MPYSCAARKDLIFPVQPQQALSGPLWASSHLWNVGIAEPFSWGCCLEDDLSY